MIKATRTWAIFTNKASMPVLYRIGLKLDKFFLSDGRLTESIGFIEASVCYNGGIGPLNNNIRYGCLLVKIKGPKVIDYAKIRSCNLAMSFVGYRLKPTNPTFVIDLSKPRKIHNEGLQKLLNQFGIEDLYAPVRLPLNPIHSEPLPLP